MSADAELIAAQARITELEGASRAAAKGVAVAAALSAYDLQPGAPSQIAALIDPSISIQRTADGREVVMGPGFLPLEDHVRATLTKPEFAHFKRQSGYGPTSAPGPAAQTQAQAAAESWTAQPGENLGMVMLRRAQAFRSQGGADPRMDPSKSILRGIAK